MSLAITPSVSIHYPPHMSLNGDLVIMDTTVSVDHGSLEQALHADIYLASLKITSQPTTSLPIIVKAFRFLPEDSIGKAHLRAAFRAFRAVWDGAHRSNEGISPIWPATVCSAGHILPAIAAPYYRHGNIAAYLRQYTTANKLDLARQLADIIAFLHARNIVHANICPENVCVDVEGRVRVTDLGVSALVRQTNGVGADRLRVPASWMYKPQEELRLGIVSSQADVYSYGSVIYSMHNRGRVFVSTIPPYRMINQVMVRGHINIVSKPEEMGVDLWEIVRCCWAVDPAQRPSMMDVVVRMRQWAA